MEQSLREDRPHPQVLRFTLDDPSTRNALGIGIRAALVDGLQRAAADAECRVVILAAIGPVFASGSDIRVLAASTPEDVMRPELRAVWSALLDFPKPLVIALNGHALGGGLELALTGDIILAARGIRLGSPEPKLGIMPGGGATQRLVRYLGWHRAMQVLLTAEPVTAETALAWGLIAEICDAAELPSRALKVAEGMAALPPLALAAIKRVARDGAALPLRDGLALEAEAFVGVFRTADRQEGLSAFLDKRLPRFKGE
ncbi:MAG: enoyl-CoA hydratase/isomerase family protein [Bauldia sp.]|nr:enoyl-CoA hydratase/isomerase family protein [Bauldia sp.]